jgi:hypothetical protein
VDIAHGEQIEAGDWNAMRRERRKPTGTALAAITSSRPVVRRVFD